MVATGTAEGEDDHDDNGGESDGGEVTALHDLVAGGVAGSASVVVGHPFDTIKVRMQTSSAPRGGAWGAAASSPVSLFRGMAAPLSTAAAVNAIIFGTYGSCTRLWEDVLESNRADGLGVGRGREDQMGVHGAMSGEGAVLIEHGEHGTHEQLRERRRGAAGGETLPRSDAGTGTFQWLSERQNGKPSEHEAPVSSAGSKADDARNQNTLKVFTCGAMAGTVQAFVICPMEHIKCRLQVQSSSTTLGVARHSYKGPVDVCKSILKNHGLSGLYRGMAVTLWRETPAFGMYFATYDTVKGRVEDLLEEGDGRHPIPSHTHAWAASALAGGISGAWTWAIIYPFDVIKTRIQTGPLERHLRKGMVTVARDILRKHGWSHMFRGLGVTLARAFPVNAIIFPVYEFVLMQLGDG